MEYNPQNGEVTLPIGGRQRTLGFTMGALMLFADGFPGGIQAGFEALENTRLEAVASLTYHALKARKKVNELPADFSEELCADWVAELLFTPDKSAFNALAGALVQSMQAVGNRMGLTTTTTTTTTPAAASPLPALT